MATGDGGRAAQRSRAQYAQVAHLVDRGEFAQAEALLRRLSGPRPSVANQVYLARIEASGGRLQESESLYRAILGKNPRNVQALAGLAALRARAGKPEEAEALFLQAEALPGGAAIGPAHAAVIRQQAEQTADPQAQISLLRTAVESDPANAWLRLELARALHGQLQDPAARAVMAPVTARAQATPDQLQAAIYFHNEMRDDREVVRLVDRLPRAAQTPQLLGLRTAAETRADIADAQAQGRPAERDDLLALATRPDPSGTRVSAVGTELIRIGDKPAAREAVRLALAARPATADQRIAYAGTLLAAGYPDDARRITRDVTPSTGLMTQQLTQVQDGAAVAKSDRLNAAGQPAAAYDQLAPRLAATPDDPDLNLALARLYAANQQPRKAVQITGGMLEQNPSSLPIRSAATSARLAEGDYAQAAAIARESTVEFPDEPQAWLDLASAERARAHPGAALRALETARTLRQKQLSDQQQPERPAAALESLPRYAQYVPPGTASDAPDPVTRHYASYVPSGDTLPIEPHRVETAQDVPFGAPVAGNPFHPGSSPLPVGDEPAPLAGAAPADPMTAQIDQGIDQLRPEVAPRLEGSLALRGRTGDPGFERLIEVSTPVEASFSPGGTGRLKVVVTPTYLYSGQGSGAYDIGRFGTNPLGGLGPAAAALRNQSAGGAALDVGYAYGIASADVGVTPLGFREQSVVGGVELAPRLSSTMTLRLLAERRAVTDSVLSYAGLRDERTNQDWGGVTRARGHIQLEGTAGLFNYYAGGGGGYLTGHDVASNTEIDAGAGADYRVWHTPTEEVRVGAELIYFGYNKNLSGFSLGQGGYFSPHEFYALLLPVTYRNQLTPDFRFSLGGAIGYQVYDQKSSNVFPNDAALQAQLVGLAAATPGLATTINGGRGSGPAGGANGEFDYRVDHNLHVGARAGFDHAGDFTEGTGLVYARYVFDDGW